MSWSVSVFGKPAAVKAACAVRFTQCKESTASIPHEQESVGLIEQIVNGQIDYLSELPGVCIKVEASGSAYKTTSVIDGKQVSVGGNSQVKLDVTPVWGLVE